MYRDKKKDDGMHVNKLYILSNIIPIIVNNEDTECSELL